MIRQSIYFLTVLMVATSVDIYPNKMVTNTAQAIQIIRSGVLHEAKDIKKDISKPAWLVKWGMWAGRYDSEMRSNAAIARPFFVVKNADQCLSQIGSESDVIYLNSVFEEFYTSGVQSFHRLISILHRHMMRELGLPVTTTLEQFKHIMEKTNKYGFPTKLTVDQFVIYARCVARGLYAVHWFKHGYR